MVVRWKQLLYKGFNGYFQITLMEALITICNNVRAGNKLELRKKLGFLPID